MGTPWIKGCFLFWVEVGVVGGAEGWWAWDRWVGHAEIDGFCRKLTYG
ncbi:hypothetical protein FIU87_16025 [Bacillus sp. THAF10]|nr:hypothetical protein FIU87_16025 [Bacillus sp. THAF10]